MKRLFAILAALLLVGCSTTPQPNPASSYAVTPDELVNFCIERFAWGPTLSQPLYICPSRAWVKGPFSKAWGQVLGDVDVAYIEGAFDCQSFTLDCVAFARLCHGKTPNRPEPSAALAVGGFGFTRWRNGIRHKIVVAFVKEGGKLDAVFVEPQSGDVLSLLDPEETKSCLELDLL